MAAIQDPFSDSSGEDTLTAFELRIERRAIVKVYKPREMEKDQEDNDLLSWSWPFSRQLHQVSLVRPQIRARRHEEKNETDSSQ